MKISELEALLRSLLARLRERRDQTEHHSPGLSLSTKLLISSGAISLGLVHAFRPEIAIDLVTISLIVIGILPWILPMVKTLEVPGLLKIDLAQVKPAFDKIEKDVILEIKDAIHGHRVGSAEVEATPEKEDPIDSLRNIATDNPSLAFVGFRLEIEKRLRALARKVNANSNAPLKSIIGELHQRDILPSQYASGIYNLMTLGDLAIHGVLVTPRAAKYSLDEASSLLFELDRLIDLEMEEQDI